MTTTLEPKDKLDTEPGQGVVNGPEGEPIDWSRVDWDAAEDNVRRLRQRIFTASQAGDLAKVRNLQKLMLRSHSNTLVSVRRVAQINAGRKTPGIDGKTALLTQQKAELVDWVEHRSSSWTSRAVKRVFIPKAGNTNKQRPLGIPVLADRALQARVANALEPEWEARFESRSYGFRPGRGCHDAIEAIYGTCKGTRSKRVWILDADLAAAFDHLDHDHLLNQLGTFPAKGMIAGWLKAGVVDRGRFAPTEEGAPQGGVVSPLLLNVALHGMEEAAGVRYLTGTHASHTAPGSPVVVRYADDLVALCHSREEAEQVKARLAEWLAPKGLTFNEGKTRIAHLTEGFDFLGCHVRRYANGKLIIKPSKAAVQRIRKRLRTEMRGPARGERRSGAATTQPHHQGLGCLLPNGGVQARVYHAGRLCVVAHFQMGRPQPPEQTEVLGASPVLRRVQPVPARQLGVRRPRYRRLPHEIRLDKDRPTPDRRRLRIPG